MRQQGHDLENVHGSALRWLFWGSLIGLGVGRCVGLRVAHGKDEYKRRVDGKAQRTGLKAIRDEYLIVDGGRLAGTGAYSYTVSK